MKPEWIEYTGSDEQIAELKNSPNGYLVRLADGRLSHLAKNYKDSFSDLNIKEYLICQPHPNADMIDLWKQTGLPVWYKAKECASFTGLCLGDEFNLYPFANPDKYEYSFTPFGEEV